MTTSTVPGGTAAAPVPTTRARLDGVDVARAIAIVGMATAHFGPRPPIEATDLTAWIYASFAGKASLLFVLVAGVGVSLLSARYPVRTVRARLLYRTVWLFPLGLWLQSLETGIAVILQYYAVWFALAVPFVGRPAVVQRRWAVGLALVGSLAALWTFVAHPEWVVPMRGDSPGGVLSDVLLFGYYPSVTWLPVLVFGMALGQQDLASTRTRITMVAGGTGAVILATWTSRFLATGMTLERTDWNWVLTTQAHSQMPLWLVAGVGFSVAVLGASLLAAEHARGLLRPVADLGRMALTIYVAHLIVFDQAEGLLIARTLDDGVRKVVWFGVVSTVVSTLWLRVRRRGPLEAIARAGWRVIEPRVTARPSDDAGRSPSPADGRGSSAV